MSKKRKTKAQRENEEKAALKARLMDILRGAFGGYEWPETGEYEPEHLPFMFGMETFGRFVGAVEKHILAARNDEYLASPTNLENWETIEGLTDFLHRMGVRADGGPPL